MEVRYWPHVVVATPVKFDCQRYLRHMNHGTFTLRINQVLKVIFNLKWEERLLSKLTLNAVCTADGHD
jgi:hypothetical protein